MDPEPQVTLPDPVLLRCARCQHAPILAVVYPGPGAVSLVRPVKLSRTPGGEGESRARTVAGPATVGVRLPSEDGRWVIPCAGCRSRLGGSYRPVRVAETTLAVWCGRTRGRPAIYVGAGGTLRWVP